MRAASVLLTIIALALPEIATGDVMEATKRARSGDFDATGEVLCAQEVGQALGPCRAEVARSGPSGAAVVVSFPNGFARILTFEAGAFMRGNATMSGVGTDVEWTLVDGIYEVRVDDQRFAIPRALVFGEGAPE